MSELMQLPLSHYMERYRKAFADMQFIGGGVAELEQQLAFMKGQRKMATEELETAERALRSAVIVSGMREAADEVAQAGEIPEPVVKVLQQQESLQPKPEDEKKPS